MGEEWWVDVLADPRARRHTRVSQSRSALTIYRLRDKRSAIILIACTRCDWKAAYSRDELTALHDADRAMPNLRDARASLRTLSPHGPRGLRVSRTATHNGGL